MTPRNQGLFHGKLVQHRHTAAQHVRIDDEFLFSVIAKQGEHGARGHRSLEYGGRAVHGGGLSKLAGTFDVGRPRHSPAVRCPGCPAPDGLRGGGLVRDVGVAFAVPATSSVAQKKPANLNTRTQARSPMGLTGDGLWTHTAWMAVCRGPPTSVPAFHRLSSIGGSLSSRPMVTAKRAAPHGSASNPRSS